MKQSFEKMTIAVPESRQLDVLANLFSKRGATTLRCPLVSILDSPEQTLVRQWLEDFTQSPPDFFIVLTGEGIKRLTAFAERFELLERWKTALQETYIIARGPKPNRALKLLNCQADELAVIPTTDGMIETLKQKTLEGKQLAVQLYGEDPNTKLQDFLQSRSVEYSTVAPYVYASDSDIEQVIELIHTLAAGKVDLICFTSKAQYSRLDKVAVSHQLQESLKKGLNKTKIAAVGPVVADQLKEAGFDVAITPDSQYFMKPMVRAIERLFS